MKLIELLARELKEWPSDYSAGYCVQSDDDGEVFFGGPANSVWLSANADDSETAKPTRAEWEAAVAARLTGTTPTLETMLTEWRDLEARAQAAQAEADALFEHAGQCHGEIVVRLAELGWGAPRGRVEPDAWVVDGHTAPDDATHFAVESDSYRAAWMKPGDGEWYCMLLDSNIWQLSGEDAAAVEWISRPSAQS